MASIRQQSRKPGHQFEIRECRATERGPRQYTLARFRDILTPDVIEEAAARAQRPFDREQLIALAERKGIPVSRDTRSQAARRLLAELRAGQRLDPSLVRLLKEALALAEAAPLPEHLSEAADWLGESEAVRGRALRGLLRTASRVVQSRGAIRAWPEEPFPRFSSTNDPAAADLP